LLPEEAPSLADGSGPFQGLPPRDTDLLLGDEDELPDGKDGAPEIEITEPVLYAVFGADFPVILRALVADAEDPPEDLRVAWEILDSGEILASGLVPSSAGEVVSAAWLDEGTYSLLAIVSDSAAQTAFDIVSIAVEVVEDGPNDSGNSPPTAPGVGILPIEPDEDDDLFCLVVTPSTDPDGDVLSYSFLWLRDGAPTGDLGPDLPSSATESEDTWTCEVTANDGQEDGPPGSASVYLEQTCPATWSVSIDGFTVIEEPAGESLPSLPVYVGFTANAPAWQTAAVFVDDLDIAVPAGGPTTWSTDFSPASGSWYRAVGCHQCNNSGVQNGRIEMNSDWNIVTSDVSLDMSQGFTLSYELRWSPLAGVTSLRFGLWTPSNVCNSCCPSASCSQSWGHVDFNLSTGGVSLWTDGLELATGIMPAPALADETWHSVEVSLVPAAAPCP
jgi:hypothetical protein